MVIQLVRVSINPDQREKWLDIVRATVAGVRDEAGSEGCVACEDLENANNFVLVERWRDLEAQYDHFRRPEFSELMGSLDDVLAGPPEISIHEVASTLTLEEALAAAGVGG
jgi:quinol monooxygenase YgiN